MDKFNHEMIENGQFESKNDQKLLDFDIMTHRLIELGFQSRILTFDIYIQIPIGRPDSMLYP